MKFPRRSPLPRWLARVSPGLLALPASESTHAAVLLPSQNTVVRREDQHASFGFAYDGVLGTSLDAQLDAVSARDSAECESRVLAEIDRLEKILSPCDPTSEFSRVRAGDPVASSELADVLAAYELWSARTKGALHVNLAEVTALWREAARTGCAPTDAALAAAFAAPHALAIDALGKAYVIDRATAVAREFAASGLLNLGGDLRAWGERTWMVDVANPFDPADNARPLAQFPLRDAAVATSGGYARNFIVGARRHSHLIDPRTLRPLSVDRAATVVAADCVTANALSTALCVLGAREATPLARAFAIDHLRVGSSGDLGATRGFGDLAPLAAESLEGAWPANYQVSIQVSLKIPGGNRAKKPYVAVWVEDAEHQLVRTLTVWGVGKYQPDLTKWWRAVGSNRLNASAVTRSTRFPGSYSVTWDGRDSSGKPVAKGDYTIFVEINREHGHHVWESATVSCSDAATSAELRDTAESDAGAITYGPRGG